MADALSKVRALLSTMSRAELQSVILFARELGGISESTERWRKHRDKLLDQTDSQTAGQTEEPTRGANGGANRVSPAPPSSIYPEGFEKFWEKYPKKVAKADAFKAWRHKKKRIDLEPLTEEILAGLERNRAYLTRDSGEYIPNPATWLNAKRWQDDATPAQKAESSPMLNGVRNFIGRHDDAQGSRGLLGADAQNVIDLPDARHE